MKAVILAAGAGLRLKPITDSKPKTLVKVNNKPILHYILDSLKNNNINEIVICIGYKGEILKNYCELNFPEMHIQYVENNEHDVTNNMYSLYLARDFIQDDIILMNADLVYDERIITLLKDQNTSCIAVDPFSYFEESMKVVVEKERVIAISKAISKEKSYGCSIDIYKILRRDTGLLINEMDRIINVDKDKNQWTEVMLNNLLKSQLLQAKPISIRNYKWVEVDNFEDLSKAEQIFNKKLNKLKRKKVFFIDRDGTLTLENNKIDKADSFINSLISKKKFFYILTNNSSRTPKQHLEALKKTYPHIKSKNILLSTDSACAYLKSKKYTDIYWVANKKVSEYLTNQKFNFNDTNPSALLLTYDDEVYYEKLKKLCGFVKSGVPYFATHADVTCPTREGSVPDIGTFIEVVRMTTGRMPNLTFGKPERILIDNTLKKLNLDYHDAVVVGDRLYTDIKLAENTSITSILVLSGETKRENYEDSEIIADIVINNVGQLSAYL